MADRADWDAATCAQRHLAVAADAELRRRHPGQHFPPLRSAEPEPATNSQRAELTPTAGQPGEMGQWIKDLASYDEMRRGNLLFVKVGRRRIITRHHLQQFLGDTPHRQLWRQPAIGALTASTCARHRPHSARPAVTPTPARSAAVSRFVSARDCI
jgi:hypothetical protein